MSYLIRERDFRDQDAGYSGLMSELAAAAGSDLPG